MSAPSPPQNTFPFTNLERSVHLSLRGKFTFGSESKSARVSEGNLCLCSKRTIIGDEGLSSFIRVRGRSFKVLSEWSRKKKDQPPTNAESRFPRMKERVMDRRNPRKTVHHRIQHGKQSSVERHHHLHPPTLRSA